MKRFFQMLFLPFYWLWKFFSTGLSVLSNLVFLGILLLGLGLILYTPEVRIPAESALVFAPEGSIVEVRSPMDPVTRAINKLAGAPLHEEVFLQDVLDMVNQAADDARIKLLVLKPDRISEISLDQIRVIGSALEAFKKKGKRIVAFGDSFNQAQYYLASWADKIYLNPMGAVHLRGFALYRLYMREMLDKLAVNFHVFRVGAFKSALEPFLRDDMSPEDREASQLWLGNLWNVYCADIARNRKLTVDNLRENIDNLVANLASVNGDRAQLAMATGLVDGLKTHPEMEAELKTLLGTAADASAPNQVGFHSYLQTVTASYDDARGKDQLIGIITASGNIIHGHGTVGQIGSDDLIRRIRKAREDKRVKAIVLRLSTGGGSAIASELIRQELLLARKEGKPVVVSMGAMAASGGYWLAADADSIVASPVTLTGSIGIFGAVPTVENTLARIGVHGDGVGTTAVSHFGNPTTAMSEAERTAFQLDVEQGYRQFLDIVAAGRKMPREEVARIAEGRVWDGETALKLRLVDTLGDLDAAIAEAARLAKAPAENGYYIELKPSNYMERFKQAEKPIEALVARMAASSSLAALLGQAQAPPLAALLGSPDPRSLYTHSLLPESVTTGN